MHGHRMFCTVSLLTFASAATALAGIAPDAIRCRDDLLAGAGRFARTVVQQSGVCHRTRLNGGLPATVDCNDDRSWAADAFSGGFDALERNRSWLETKVEAACTAPIPAIGLYRCPAPCEGGDLLAWSEVVACLRCVGTAAGRDLSRAVHGSPPEGLTPNTPAWRCQGRLERAVRSQLDARLRLQRLCERTQTGSTSCRNVDTLGHPSLAAAERRANGLVARCESVDQVDLATELDSCATTIAGEQACLRGAAIGASVAILEPVFPIPIPTPSPTVGTGSTATSTATITPTGSTTPTPCATGTPCPPGEAKVCPPDAVFGDSCRCSCEMLPTTRTPTPIPEGEYGFTLSIEPPDPAVGDDVTIAITATNLAGQIYVPAYTLNGTAPFLSGDTSTRHLPHLMGTGQSHTLVYTLHAEQAGTANAQLHVDYETCMGTCPPFYFTATSFGFEVQIDAAPAPSPTTTPPS